MALTRIDMRIDESVKAAAEKAATLKGMKSLTEYVTKLIEKDATEVIQAHQSIKVQDDVFDRFMAACEAAESPNQKLKDAHKFANKTGIK